MRILIGISLLLLFTACQEDYLFRLSGTTEELEKLKSEISFTYSVANGDTDSVYDFRSINVSGKSSGWLIQDDKLELIREISFGNSLVGNRSSEPEVSLWIRKVERDSSLVRLEDRESHYWERIWDYLSYEDEAENFYRHYTDARLIVNGKVLFSGDESGSIEVISTKKVMIEGEEKTWVEIHFEGGVFGVYDPFKEYEGYIVRNGVFKGIIE
jgi:hypothetical protein